MILLTSELPLGVKTESLENVYSKILSEERSMFSFDALERLSCQKGIKPSKLEKNLLVSVIPNLLKSSRERVPSKSIYIYSHLFVFEAYTVSFLKQKIKSPV